MASTPVQSIPQLNNMFKEIYGTGMDAFTKACPEIRDLQTDFPFASKGAEPGTAYSRVVRMTEEQGISFRKANTAATTMRPPVALSTQKAQFTGSVIEFRSRTDLDTMLQAANDKQAFKDSVGLRQEAQRDSIFKHLEWSLLHGGRPLCKITNVAAGGNALQKVLTMDSSFVVAFWAASENMCLDIYDPTSVTKRNASASVAYYSVDGYDLDAKTITVSVIGGATSDATAITANDLVYRAGALGNETLGLLGLTAAQTGVVNGIDAGQYAMWRGVVDATGGVLTMNRVLNLAARIGSRSSTKKNFTLRISLLGFNSLQTELTALRKFDNTYKMTAQNGFAAIEYFSPNGKITIKPHPFMRDSEAHLSNDATVERRGVSDVIFTMPGSEEQMYLLLPEQNTWEYRAYSNQGLVNWKPCESGLFTGLTLAS